MRFTENRIWGLQRTESEVYSGQNLKLKEDIIKGLKRTEVGTWGLQRTESEVYRGQNLRFRENRI